MPTPDGELLIWIGSNRAFHALSDSGKTFEEEVGAPVKVETQEKIIDKAIVIMWDYKTPYSSWPFLASAGGYPFATNGEVTPEIALNDALKNMER